MIKSKVAKTLILGACLTVSLSGLAYASESEAQLAETQGQRTLLRTIAAGSPDIAVSSPSITSSEEDNDILQKQREVDQYVFEQHKDEIAQKGFKVTHTGPLYNFVEIGIEPYNEDNAEYLYNIFGEDKVKVVEGQQAYTLGLASADDGIVSEVKASVDAASGEKSESEAGSKSVLRTLVYTLGAITVLGAAVVALNRVLPIGKK